MVIYEIGGVVVDLSKIVFVDKIYPPYSLPEEDDFCTEYDLLYHIEFENKTAQISFFGNRLEAKVFEQERLRLIKCWKEVKW